MKYNKPSVERTTLVGRMILPSSQQDGTATAG